jgi:hypothetical protein
MFRLVHSVALAAALVTVAVCVWRDIDVATALGRVVIAYLTTFGLGVAGVIGLRAAAASPDPPKPAVARPETMSASDTRESRYDG